MRTPALNLLKSLLSIVLLTSIVAFSFTSCNKAGSDPQPVAPEVTLKSGDVYYIKYEGGKSSIVKFSEGSTSEIFTQDGAVYGLAADRENNTVYWANYTQNKIYFADPEMKNVRSFNANRPYFVKVYENKLYWTTAEGPSINAVTVADLDGSNAQQLFKDNLVGQIRDIEFSTFYGNKTMYYTSDQGLKMINMSLNNQVSTLIKGNLMGLSLAPDADNINTQVIFTSDYSQKNIYRINYENNWNVTTIISNAAPYHSLTFNSVDNKLYYSNANFNLSRSDEYGSGKSVYLNVPIVFGGEMISIQ